MVNLPDVKLNMMLPAIKGKLPDIKVNLPKMEMVNVSRVVLISGILTFLYLIEFCLGIRNVYHTFTLWNSSPYVSQYAQVVSWPLCVACLFLCATSSFTANLISAMWEQKQLKEKGQEKSAIRFAFHIIVGGMIWRYVCLWFSDNKELQKKEAMLLTMAKFLFTQFYTIPMIIVSASLLEDFQEIIYNLCAVACISVTLLLTCIMFSWCKTEVDDLKKWSFETIDLVPLIFCQSSADAPNPQIASKSDENKESGNSTLEVPKEDDNAVETAFLRIIVLLQTFSFTFGRLLALGILLRIAGIYTVSIMFLQLLISVVYLKFQVPFLVSDSLPKWRQLGRLAFMSYILIFEWHLNRDPISGYDFTSNIKHSMLYYVLATLESIFYFVTWAITESYESNNYMDYLESPKRKFVRNLIIVGSMSLVFSLTVYILLMFWQSRRLSKLLHSIQRNYLSSKLKMVNSGSRNWMKRKDECKPSRPQIDISNPITIYTTTDISSTNDELSELERHTSYRDLREPIDDEIDLYVRNEANDNEFKTSLKKITNEIEKSPVKTIESYSKKGIENSNVEKKEDDEKFEVEAFESEECANEIRISPAQSNTSSPAVINVSKHKNEEISDNKSIKNGEKSPRNSYRSDKNCSSNGKNCSSKGSELERHTSYRDLREPIDDEIDLYVRNEANDNEFKTSLKKITNDIEKSPMKTIESYSKKGIKNSNVEKKEDDEKFEAFESKERENEIRFSPTQSNTSSPAVINVSKNKNEEISDNKSIENGEKSPRNSCKSDKNCSSNGESTNVPSSTVKLKMNMGWNKFSSLSLKFTGAMKEQIQKRKEQLQNFRSSSGNDNNTQPASTSFSETGPADSEQTVPKTEEEPDSSEGYFMGDSRCHDDGDDGIVYQSSEDNDNDCKDTETEEDESEPPKSASVVNLYEEASDPEPVHCEGDQPCPCFVCKTMGEGQILRRRRSSSVPLPERKTRRNMASRVFPEESALSRFASASNIVQMDTASDVEYGKTKMTDISHSPKLYNKGSFQNLSVISLENRIEHYV